MDIDSCLSHPAEPDDRVNAQLAFFCESAHSRVFPEVHDWNEQRGARDYWGDLLYFFIGSGTFVPYTMAT